MTISPDKKQGKLTGRYRVEVQRGDRRLRGRADTLKEAKVLEDSFRSQLENGEVLHVPKRERASPPSPKIATALHLSEAVSKARGLLWAGQATEFESFRKLKRLEWIVGGETSIDDFDANAVDKVVRELQGGGVKDSTINRYLSCMSAFLTFCKRRGWKTTDVPEMDWRDEDEGRIRWITYEEEKALIAGLPHPYGTLVFIAIRTGLRASELLTLTPEQVEPAWIRLWKTKNRTVRSVPITKEIYQTLAPLVTRGLPEYHKLRHEWDKVRKDMRLLNDSTFTFHACRHTYATRAVQAGVNIRVLQKLMGHKAIQTTLRYAHVDDQTLTDAVASALTFHDDRWGNEGGGIPLHFSARGAIGTSNIRVLEKTECLPADCKSVHAGSIPARASISFPYCC